ncbi:hypothetical protein [Streptomyces lunaelactis]|uniref:hypothetical protein n=1 Tax=Streptomyces lunaelactis TaxID=1535768 RepID=UPI001585CD57|nr:hypothetical protein [Streptomyces lunaelactis]NUL13258.1 hypothetical protein [Streptomyces lunaelactis]
MNVQPSPPAQLDVARCEIARLQDVIAKQATDNRELTAAAAEARAQVEIRESQLHTVDQQWGAIAAAVHDWEMGDLTADQAIRRVRDIQAPARTAHNAMTQQQRKAAAS